MGIVLEINEESQEWWYIPTIPDTQEVESKRIKI
jgi:hypothetical protein